MQNRTATNTGDKLSIFIVLLVTFCLIENWYEFFSPLNYSLTLRTFTKNWRELLSPRGNGGLLDMFST